jgi:hypothetical protein
MKSFEIIAIEAISKDYQVVAEIAGCSIKNIHLVVKRKRGDHFNIQKIFNDWLIGKEYLKEDLKLKYIKKKNRE